MRQWGGRFTFGPGETMLKYSVSLHYESRLFGYDIAGSQAHVKMLEKQGVLTSDEAALLQKGLEEVRARFEAGDIPQDASLEDIHTAVESTLRSLIGDLAGKVHTGRSRNDQIALDMHLWCKDASRELGSAIKALQKAIYDKAVFHQGIVAPGYTHLQRAQPVLLSHYLMSYFWMLERDRARFGTVGLSSDVSPLGAAALAGSTFPLDPAFTAHELGLGGIYMNSMDAVSDRDFLLELCFACSTTMVHLSRLAEEVIIWSTSEFGFAELSDAVTTGSSIMPQKKNADSAELIRGRSARVIARLMGLLATMKGLPLTYCRDLQEDKETVFEAFDVTLASLEMAKEVVLGLTFKSMSLEKAASDWPLMATDVADRLARQGLPFREAHGVVGNLVKFCSEQGKSPAELTPAELNEVSPHLTPDITGLFDPFGSVKLRDYPMGTGPTSVKMQLEKALKILNDSPATE
jgi:argininosuccinate lyase